MLALLTHGQKPISSLEAPEMGAIAAALAGPNASLLVDLFNLISKSEADTKVVDVLRTEEAGRLLEAGIARLNARNAEETTALCRCPVCNFAFETPLL